MQIIKEWVNNKGYYPYIFPIIIIFFLILLTLTKVSGTSTGQIKQIFKPNLQDKALLFGHPRPIRSDEWATATPLIVSQHQLGYPEINGSIGEGQDMSVLIDAPTKSWDTLFKPQNYMFFILPFEMAFSFRWWFMLALLLISGYLVLRLFLPPPLVDLKAALLSVALSFAPFIMWWYAGGTLLAMAYSLLIVFSFYILINTKKLLTKLGFAALAAYCLVALAFTFYIPFIMASVFACAFVLLSLISKDGLQGFKKILTTENLFLLISVAVIAVSLLILFYFQHKEVIKIIQNTAYPGKRIASEAPLKISSGLDIFGQFFLQSGTFVKINQINQSEASNFIYISLYFVIIIFYFLIIDIKNKKICWPLIFLLSGLILIFIRLYLPIHSNWVFKFVMMDSIPKNRLLIILGIFNIFLLALIVYRATTDKKALPRAIVQANLAAAVLILVYQFSLFQAKYITSNAQFYAVLIISFIIISSVYLVTNKKTVVLGIIGIATLSVIFTFKINPLYAGIPYMTDPLISNIKTIDKTDPGTWAVIESPYRQYPTMAGVKNISGIMIYPQMSVWRDFPNYSQYSYVLNRYAHIGFVIAEDQSEKIVLVADDAFMVYVSPCEKFTQTHIKYFISEKEIHSRCLQEIFSENIGEKTFKVYRTINLEI